MRLAAVSFATLALVACDRQSEPVAPVEPAPAVEPAPPGAVQGRVLESLSASSYSYLRLATDAGEQWVAVPNTEVAVGTQVTLMNPLEMKGFESKTLGRRFDRILFGTLADASDKAATKAAPAPAPATAVNLDAAERSTVAAIHAGKTTLAERPVTVRGTVVKFTPRVMNRNWLHLRDGTGSDAAKDNDLTVTTTDTVAVGDTVTVTGVVRVAKDFGAGYSYAVIVEEARVTK